MRHILTILNLLMKLLSQLASSLKSLASPIIKSNVVKNTTSRFTLLFVLLYIIILYYNTLTIHSPLNIITLLPISSFTNTDTIFSVLLNIFDLDNSINILSLPLITPLKVFDYRTINETLDRYNIRDMNTRSVITQRLFNLLTMLDDDFSQIIQPMELELINWIELASDEQLSNLVTDIFSAPLSLSNLKLKGLNTNLRIRKHLIYQMFNNNKQWHITKETSPNPSNTTDKIKTIILSAIGLNLIENPDNNMGFSNDPNQLFELDEEGFITGVRAPETNTPIIEAEGSNQISDLESNDSGTEVNSDSDSETLVNDLDSDDEADIDLMMDISDSELDSNPDTTDYTTLNSDSDDEMTSLLNPNDFTDIETLLIPFFITLSNNLIFSKIKSNKLYKQLINSKLLVSISNSKLWKHLKNSQLVKLLLTIILSIILKIIIMHIDTTYILTSASDSHILTSGSSSILDMDISDYEIWFATFLTTILDKPLPPLPEEVTHPLPPLPDEDPSHPLPPLPDNISETSSDSGYWSGASLLPPIIYKNKIFDKILKDLLRLIIQYFIDLLTSIVTSKAKSALLSVGLFGLLKLQTNNKGKAKEVNPNSDTESFIQWPEESSDTSSINTMSSDETPLGAEIEEALVRDITQERIERKIREESRKSFLQEFINKAKIAPTKELQLEMFKILFEIEKEKDKKREGLDQDNPSSSQPRLRRTKPKWQARESIASTVLDLGTKERDEVTLVNRTSAIATSASPQAIYPPIPDEIKELLQLGIETRLRRRVEDRARLLTTSAELDLGTVQREEIREEVVITPSSPIKPKLVILSEEERWKLDKLQPDLPQETLEDVWEDVINLNRFSDLKEDTKNRKLFINLQRLNNSPTPTEDTQLRTPRTEHFTDYDFRTELDASETKSFRDTFDDLSIDDRSYKAKSKTTTSLKGNKKNKKQK